MSKSALLWFWILWLLDLLMALFAYRDFIMGAFGRYAAPLGKYIALWVVVFVVALLILGGSLYFKNNGRSTAALVVAAVPIVLALPYVLFVGVLVLFGGSNTWR